VGKAALREPAQPPFWCRTCRKVAYWTESDAARTLRKAQEKYPEKTVNIPKRVYQGEICTFWHLTKQEKKRK
jgi:hypothetical protein